MVPATRVASSPERQFDDQEEQRLRLGEVILGAPSGIPNAVIAQGIVNSVLSSKECNQTDPFCKAAFFSVVSSGPFFAGFLCGEGSQGRIGG
ncbi:hypothetical protein WJX82_005876 [Trebouxia sp. C0006]